MSARVSTTSGAIANINLLAQDNGLDPPAVAYDGVAFLVLWAGRGIQAVRVAQDGSPIDVTPLQITPWQAWWSPRLVWTGTNFHAVWANYLWAFIERPIAPPPPLRLHAARISTSGITFDDTEQPTIADDAMYDALEPRIASSGDRLLIAWTGWESDLLFHLSIAELSNSGVVVIPRKDIVAGKIDQAAIAWNGTEFVLVWMEYTDLGSVVRFARLDRYANLLDAAPFPLLTSTRAGFPDVAPTDSGVVFVYNRIIADQGISKNEITVRTLERLPAPPPRRRAVLH